ncbi:olfactory receptor 10R2-like [Alligator mississippiensis]|uniref:Olfactory receptor n=1 Tax=Alligator mississippiensis TaxID=8496 RepID=A0A151P401_ALLMI|nr:olfactory receptor 10R2-like [Alligator mississippiensis]KYO43778.1 olfactory receptor 10R2-like [Alligator mississippiensis]
MNTYQEENQNLSSGFFIIGFSNTAHPLRLFFFALFCPMYMVTLIGNLLIVTLTVRDQALHTPMYFFLGSLSTVEVGYTLVIVPKMLAGFLVPGSRAISFWGCATQMYFFVALGGSECFLLVAMAYDRYVAICHPLHYASIMSWRARAQLLLASCAGGFTLALGLTILVFQLPFCQSKCVNHVFCDIPAVLALACGDNFLNEMALLVACLLILIFPFLFILVSYSHILRVVIQSCSAEGRRKAFSTCASHLTVAVLHYGCATSMYIRPTASHSLEQDKLVSLIYINVTPLLYPAIYTLRNKDFSNALGRVLAWQRYA